jgi:predicted ATP-binding protein involved in virulence
MISIKFEKLFGRFDYNVIFNLDGLTILTGPNGYGKSTILKAIEAMTDGFMGVMFFTELDFKRISATFKDGKKIDILKDNNVLSINGVKIDGNYIRKQMLQRPLLRPIDDNIIFNRRTGRTMEVNQYIKDYIETHKFELLEDKEFDFSEKTFLILEEMKKLVGKIYFIKEQRLIRKTRVRYDEKDVINVIEELPTHFKKLMQSVQEDYSNVASRLDSSYPNRLFNMNEGINKKEYEYKIEEMRVKFEKLNKYNLSNIQRLDNVIFKEEHAKALKIYFDDFDKKYKAYENFIAELDLYTDIINHRLSFKEMRISKKSGISIVDENGKKLKLTQLSSGEKQEIVLFYDLIFKTKEKVLLLIDEPEISLHITWQKKFMDDLLRIIKYKKFNVIVATHSPQIINNHWERQIDLGELYAEQQFDKK